ncbi:MAG: hypothetical protein ACI9QV_000501, partial [Methylophagaceae bacterium]
MAVQKKYRGAVRPFYVTLVFVFLLLSGGFYWLAGAINQQQAATADWVSEKLGHEVEIEQAKLSWVKLSPKLELSSVKILADDGLTEMLSLDKLYLSLDIYDSIRYAGVRLDDITIKGLKVGVVRDNNGLIALQGLNQQGDSTPLFAELLVRSKALNSVHLNAITVDFTDHQQSYLTGRYQVDNIAIQHQSNKWQGSGEVNLPSSLGDNIHFTANWLLNEKQPEMTTWQWAVEIKNMHLSTLKDALVFKNVMVKQGNVDAQLRGEGIGSRLNKSQLVLALIHGQLGNK